MKFLLVALLAPTVAAFVPQSLSAFRTSARLQMAEEDSSADGDAPVLNKYSRYVT